MIKSTMFNLYVVISPKYKYYNWNGPHVECVFYFWNVGIAMSGLKSNVATLALGLRPRQGLARLRAKYEA